MNISIITGTTVIDEPKLLARIFVDDQWGEVFEKLPPPGLTGQTNVRAFLAIEFAITNYLALKPDASDSVTILTNNVIAHRWLGRWRGSKNPEIVRCGASIDYLLAKNKNISISLQSIPQKMWTDGSGKRKTA